MKQIGPPLWEHRKWKNTEPERQEKNILIHFPSQRSHGSLERPFHHCMHCHHLFFFSVEVIAGDTKTVYPKRDEYWASERNTDALSCSWGDEKLTQLYSQTPWRADDFPEPQNNLDWKRPSNPLSPTINQHCLVHH